MVGKKLYAEVSVAFKYWYELSAWRLARRTTRTSMSSNVWNSPRDIMRLRHTEVYKSRLQLGEIEGKSYKFMYDRYNYHCIAVSPKS